MAKKRISTAELAWDAISRLILLTYDLDDLKKKYPSDETIRALSSSYAVAKDILVEQACRKQDVWRVVKALEKRSEIKRKREAVAKERAAKPDTKPRKVHVPPIPVPRIPTPSFIDPIRATITCGECGVERPESESLVCVVCRSTRIKGVMT